MKNLKLSFENLKKNELLRAQLTTVFGGGEYDSGDKPKPGTTTSNSGVGVTKISQSSLPLTKPLL
jgi:hypothetical protein